MQENYQYMHKLNQMELEPGLGAFHAIRPGNGSASGQASWPVTVMRDERHSQICGSQTQSKAECQCQFVDSIIITDILDDCINFVNFSSQQGINPFNHIQQLSDMLVVSTMPTDKTLTGQRLSHMLFFHYQTYTFKPHSKFNSPFCQLQLYIILLHCLCLSCVYNLQQFFYSAVFLHVSGFLLRPAI